MKLSDITPPKNRTPFIKTDRLEVVTIDVNGLISEFEVILDGVEKVFKTNGDPLKAWKEVEKFCRKLS